MITFKNTNITPIKIEDKDLIINDFYRQGFAIIDGKTLANNIELDTIAEKLNLGSAHTSEYNKKFFPNKNKNKKSEIGKKDENKDKHYHPVFEDNDALEQHVDGTFSPLGEIKTTVLLCKQPAIHGGDTTLFNVYGAIAKIEEEEPGVTIPFRNPLALRRKSTFPGIDKEYIDCVLGEDPIYKREIIRIAFDSSANWEYSFEKVNGLEYAYKKLLSIKENDGDYSLTFPLQKGDVIIIDNTRITHGRTAFKQDKDNPRMMVRAVHTKLPE